MWGHAPTAPSRIPRVPRARQPARCLLGRRETARVNISSRKTLPGEKLVNTRNGGRRLRFDDFPPLFFVFLSFFFLFSFCRSTTVEFHWISLSLSLRFSPLVFRYSSRFSFTSVFLVGDRICFLFYPVIYLMFRHESLFDPCSVSLQKKKSTVERLFYLNLC